METVTELSMYDIGIIGFKLKKYITVGTLITGLIQSGIVDQLSAQSSCIIKVKEGKSIFDIKSMIDLNISMILRSNYTDILNVIASLGFKDPAQTFNMILHRTNMFYTVLQLSENEFNIIVI